MTALARATSDAEAVMDAADTIADLGYQSIRDVLIVAAGQALGYAMVGNREPLQHLAALRSQCDGLIAELHAGRSSAGQRP